MRSIVPTTGILCLASTQVTYVPTVTFTDNIANAFAFARPTEEQRQARAKDRRKTRKESLKKILIVGELALDLLHPRAQLLEQVYHLLEQVGALKPADNALHQAPAHRIEEFMSMSAVFAASDAQFM